MNTALTIRRLYAQSRDEVFSAWTDPASLQQWMCGTGAVESDAELDVRVGGAFKIVMHYKGKAYLHTGAYQVVDPPKKLQFTWISAGTDDTESVVTLDFHQVLEGTEMVLTHERLPERHVESHRQGWTEFADILEKWLAEKKAAV